MATRESRCPDRAGGRGRGTPAAAEPVAAGAPRHVPAFQSREEKIQPGMVSRDEISRWSSLEPTCLLHQRPEAHPGSEILEKDLASPPGGTSLITSALSFSHMSSSRSPRMTPLLPGSPAATLLSQVYFYLPSPRTNPSRHSVPRALVCSRLQSVPCHCRLSSIPSPPLLPCHALFFIF